MKTSRIGLTGIGIVTCIVTLFIFFMRGDDRSNFFDHATQGTPETPIFIAHAGGEIDNRRYTNSLEAVENSLAMGYKAIELDLRETSDGVIYAAHDPKIFRRDIGIEEKRNGEDKDPHSSQIAGKLLHRTLTPLDEKKISEIFSSDPSAVLITDKIRNYEAINKNFTFKDRIYVEVFSPKDYIRATALGIKHPMLNINAADTQDLFIRLFNIKIVTTHTNEIIKNEKFFSGLKARGVSVLAYTVNDPAFISRYKNSISAVYSDNINPKTGMCQSDKCDIY